jgi:predicted ArsR family transcriptional regulator
MAKQTLERSLEVVALLRDPTRRRLYRYVVRQPSAVGRDEAAKEMGISRALAAFHLDKLAVVGLLRPEYRRLSARTGRGAGRTSKLYRRSAHQFDVTLPERHYDVLARLLAEAVTEKRQGAPAMEPAREYGRSLGSHARRRLRGRPASTRLLDCVEDVAEELGFDPYRDAAGEIRLRNCPFDPLSRLYTPLICGVAKAMLTGVAEAVAGDKLTVDREMRPERCCGIIRAAFTPSA